MQAIATIERPSAPATQNAAKVAIERPLSRKVRRALDLLATRKAATQKAAAEAVGLHPESLSRALSKSSARVFLEQRARQTIAVASARASERIVELVDASSEHVSLDAAKHVLAIGNIRPPENGSHVSVNVGVSVGYVLDLRPDDAGAAHTPQAGNQAQVIDNVESEER